MATCNYQEPKIFIAAGQKAPQPRIAPQAAGHTGTAIIRRADFVQITAGALSRCATNQALNVYGLAIHGELNEYTGGTPAFGLDYSNQLFGAAQVTTATSSGLLPQEPGTVHVVNPGGQQLFELSLLNTTGWVTGGTSQATIGTAVGLTLDATTGLFVADPTLGNLILTIWAISTRLGIGGSAAGGGGAPGDLGVLVLAYFNAGIV